MFSLVKISLTSVYNESRKNNLTFYQHILNKNYIKVEIFIVQGRKKQDKREYKKLQEWKKNKSSYSKY